MTARRYEARLPWAGLFQRSCRARLTPDDDTTPGAYWGRCELRRGHDVPEHALERGMVVVRWQAIMRWEGPDCHPVTHQWAPAPPVAPPSYLGRHPGCSTDHPHTHAVSQPGPTPDDPVVHPTLEQGPLTVGCLECGAVPRQACRTLEGDHPLSVGYHQARYTAAGWAPAGDDEVTP